MAKILEAKRFVDMITGCSYRYVSSKTEYFKEHSHDYYEIFIMLSGVAAHSVNGSSFKLSEGDAVFIRAQDTHNYEPIRDCVFSFLNLTFTKETLDAIFAYLSDGYPKKLLLSERFSPSVRLTSDDKDMLFRAMEKIRAISPEDASLRKTEIRVLLIKLFSDVFSRFKKNDSAPDWLMELTEKMRGDMLFVEGSAKMLELSCKSREHLSRSMKKYLGKTPSEFINEIRLSYIANMLVNSNHKIIDIILSSGFNTVSYCSMLFEKHYGKSMSEYRKTKSSSGGK